MSTDIREVDMTLPVAEVPMVEVRSDDLCLLISAARTFRRDLGTHVDQTGGDSNVRSAALVSVAIDRAHQARMEALR